MKLLLAFTSTAEAGTGLVLLVSPPLAGRLLLGTEIVGPGVVACRIAGAALIGLGVASDLLTRRTYFDGGGK